MLLTLTTTMPDAADLGFLLHKHPGKAQQFATAAGTAHVVWPEAGQARATVALVLEVDPIALVRGKDKHTAFTLDQYVNDRPYAASSMLAVALGRVFRTAMTGRCDARPELPGTAIPLEIHVPVLRSRGGPDVVERLFAPLGWQVAATALPLDERIPAWGDSPYVDLRLTGTLKLADALTQLYVLLPALDDAKHYWVGPDEVEKLLRAGAGWLAGHPERELVTRRYLSHRHSLVTTAVGRLAEVDDTEPEALDNAVPDDPETAAEDDAPPPPEPLVRLRHAAVLEALREEQAATIADVGCGEGALLRRLVEDPAFTRILGTDVSHRALEVSARRLHLDRMPDRKRARIELLQSSVTYRDDRLAGFDAVVLMEVVEHLDPPRLPALARTVFGHARPASVVVTTPNAEYNVRYETLPTGRMRHHDHRFEWTREEFRAWAADVAATHGYTVRHVPVGDDDPEVGPPTQLAVFRRVA